MRFLKALLFVIVLLFVLGVAFVMSGVYPIGADEPHWDLTARAIDLLRDRSIESHARSIAVPPLDDAKLLAEGAEHYAAMCTGCHLAPGVADTELRAGLYPMPPKLAEGGAGDAARTFWIIKHGVKLTAMPAWGKSHDDDSIWALVAFVRKLPQMTPEQYQQATGGAAEHAHHHHDHGGSNGDEHSDHEHSDNEHADQHPDAAHPGAADSPREQNGSDSGGGAPAAAPQQRQDDVRARGADVMPFSLDATQHVFEKTAGGGTQRVLARADHQDQVAMIRAHLRGIAQAFTTRDFSGPTHIHGSRMPGLAELQSAPPDALSVTYRDIDNGGEVTYRASSAALRDAVHRWFDAQLADHGDDATDHAPHISPSS